MLKADECAPYIKNIPHATLLRDCITCVLDIFQEGTTLDDNSSDDDLPEVSQLIGTSSERAEFFKKLEEDVAKSTATDQAKFKHHSVPVSGSSEENKNDSNEVQ